MNDQQEQRRYEVKITGVSGWRDGAREEAVRAGIHAAARILAARGVDCRGALDLRDECPKEIEAILAVARQHGRETVAVPPSLDLPIPGSDGEPPKDPRMATPEGRLEVVKEAAAAGKIEFAPPGRGGFVVQWSAKGFGFGEFTVSMGEDGTVRIDDECMGRGFARALFEALIAKEG